MKIKKPSWKTVTEKDESIEIQPIEKFITNKPIDLGITDEIFIARIVTSTKKETYCLTADTPIKTENFIDNGSWRIVSQKEIDDYLENGYLSKYLPQGDILGGFGQLNIIGEELIQKIEKNKTFLIDPREGYNLPDIDEDLYTTYDTKINSKKPLRLIGFKKTDIHASIQTDKDTFISTPIRITTDSDKFDLEKLVTILEKNEQFRFIKGYYKRNYSIDPKLSAPQTVFSNDPSTLTDIIMRVPHYNQNDNGDLHEITGYLSLNSEQVKHFFNKSNNYSWSDQFYQGKFTKDELKEHDIFGDTALLINCLNAEQAYKQLEHKLNSVKKNDFKPS